MKPEEELAKYKERARYWQEEFEKLRNDLPDFYHLGDFNKQSNQNQKLEAMWIEARFNYLDLCDPAYYPDGDRPDYRKQAALELALEVPAWKHIGPDEQKAIQDAIYAISHDEMRCTILETREEMQKSIDVLRKLLEGKA